MSVMNTRTVGAAERLRCRDLHRLEIASRIRQARHLAGLTQDQLGRMLGVVPSQVTRWESGEVSPHVFTIARIAAIFHIPVGDLIPEVTRD
jgi:transcriptional regulator with XRE-family HTH domain